MNKTIKYIKDTHSLLKEVKEALFHGKNVFIQDPLPTHVSLDLVLRKVEKLIPKYLVYNIDVLYVGNFDYFKERNINAMYDSGALYVSSEQDDEHDMIDDIVHEISHAVEEKYQPEIYGDSELEQEFLNKRKKLYEILKSYEYNVSYDSFMNVEYEEGFDNLLYKEIGYEIHIIDFNHQNALVAANQGVLDGQLGRIANVKDDYPNLLKVDYPLFDFNLVLLKNCRQCQYEDLKSLAIQSSYPAAQSYIDNHPFDGDVIKVRNVTAQLNLLTQKRVEGTILLEF